MKIFLKTRVLQIHFKSSKQLHSLFFYTRVFVLTLGVFSNCAFGSVGNSLTEKTILLRSLLQWNDSATFLLPLRILVLDDRGDEQINQFELISGTSKKNFAVKVDTASYWKIKEIMILMTSPTTLFSTQEPKHVESTSGSTNTNSGYYHLYFTSELFPFQFTGGSDLEGNYLFQDTIGIPLQRGRIQELRTDITEIFWKGEVESSEGKYLFELKIIALDINRKLKCPRDISAQNPSSLVLQFKHSDLFKDNSNGTILSTLSARANSSLIQINQNTNSDIYNLFIENLMNSEIFTEYRCN